MSDTFITVVAIMLAAMLVFVVPLVTTSQRVDDVSQIDVETLTSNFVDEIRTTGKLTLDDYNEFLESLSSTGNTYDVEIEFKILDENPGKKSTQTAKDKIGENVYYSLYTTQIEELLEKDEGIYNLKQGDFINVKVQNTNLTFGQQVKDFTYKIVGDDTYSISANKSGLVTANGSTSVELGKEETIGKDLITYVLRENDRNGKKLDVKEWTNQNIYVEFSKKTSYNLDTFYYWRYSKNTQDYLNDYTKLDGNNVTMTEKTEIQAYWKSSALEKYSNLENIKINIDRIKPTIGSVTTTNIKGNTGTVAVSGITDLGGSGIYGYAYKWTDNDETPTPPTKDLANWTQSSATILSIVAYPQNSEKKCTIWVRDKAGNISEGKSVFVKNIVPRITSVTIQDSMIKKKGESANIQVTLGGGTDYKSISFTSSNTSAVTVNSSGVINAVAPGKSIINCVVTNYDLTTVEDNCTVTVVDLKYNPDGGVYLYNSSKNSSGKYYATIKSNVSVQGAAEAHYAWSTSNTTTPTSWKNYSSVNGENLTITEQNTNKKEVVYYLWSKLSDTSENSVIYVSKSFKITANVITIKPNITAWTNGNVTCTITYPSASVNNTRKAAYGSNLTNAQNASNSAVAPTTKLVVTANGYVYAVASDIGGNKVTASLNIANIDKQAPSVPSIKYNSGNNSCSWQNNINITLTSTDNLTGIAHYEVDWDGDGVANTTTGSNFVPGNGYSSCNNRFRAVDGVGNRSAWTSAIHIHKDTQTPSVPTIRYNSGSNSCAWQNNINITLSSSDNVGILHYEIDTNGDGKADATTGSNFIPRNGHNSCNNRFRAVDHAGNRSGWTGSVHIHQDTQAPGVPTIRYNSGSNSCAWLNNINITLSSSENIGIAYYEIDYTGDGIADTTTGSNFVPGNGWNSHTNRFRAVDHAGNRSGWTGAIHIHQDTQIPAHTNWWYGYGDTDLITLYIQVSDNIGVQRVQCPTSTATGGYNNWVWIDAVWDASANAYRADIKPSTWGHYNTTYLTHLYIYDHAGNGGYYNQATMAIGNPVAAIGSTYYSTLAKAIDRVSSGGTITMINNTAEHVNVPSGKNINLNLNNRHISGSINNWATLNISNGTITHSGDGWTLTNYSKMNITNVNVNYPYQNNGTALMNQGTMNMIGGTVYSGGNSFVNRSGTATIRNVSITGVTAHGVLSEGGSRSEFYNCYINRLCNGDSVGRGQVFVINTSVDYIYPNNPVVSIGRSGNGFTMEMYAASNYSRAQFPTWSDAYGQDDLIWYESVWKGSYFLSSGHSLHSHPNYEKGLVIHVYVDGIGYGGITIYEW